jgi:zinc transport system substrate-binding protein
MTALMVMAAALVWTQPATAQGVPVVVSIAPQRYFVQQIGKERVAVEVMVPPGADVHTYEPKPGQMAALANARLYFAVGVPFEKVLLEKIRAANPKLRVVHTDHGIPKIPMVDHPHDQGEKEGSDEHAHGALDPHIWLSPPLVKIQTQAIRAALIESDPSHRAAYEANSQVFLAQIDRLDAELKQTFAGKQGLRFMVFHPAWGYFAQAYGLEQVPIELEGKAPKPAQLQTLITHARQAGIQVIFVQPQFSAKSARIVAKEIHGQVVVADPLAVDWLANLRAVADKLKEALR